MNSRLTEEGIYIYFLTPRIRVLLEMLIVTQLVKKFPPSYKAQRFIAAFKFHATCL
jgi:hypothetical protein